MLSVLIHSLLSFCSWKHSFVINCKTLKMVSGTCTGQSASQSKCEELRVTQAPQGRWPQWAHGGSARAGRLTSQSGAEGKALSQQRVLRWEVSGQRQESGRAGRVPATRTGELVDTARVTQRRRRAQEAAGFLWEAVDGREMPLEEEQSLLCGFNNWIGKMFITFQRKWVI